MQFCLVRSLSTGFANRLAKSMDTSASTEQFRNCKKATTELHIKMTTCFFTDQNKLTNVKDMSSPINICSLTYFGSESDQETLNFARGKLYSWLIFVVYRNGKKNHHQSHSTHGKLQCIFIIFLNGRNQREYNHTFGSYNAFS